jgi:glycosyltransferase involved in cell wall biosynthesis
VSDKLSLIIPIYNEASTLKPVWDTLHEIQWPVPVEYILVDDGSTDGSRELAKSMEPLGATVILKEKNGGKTSALIEGIRAVTGSIICVQDADLEYDPHDIVRVIQPILDDKADAVYGSRFKQSGDQVQRTYHRLGIRLLTAFSNLVTGVYLTDLEGCYKAWRSDLLKNVIVTSRGFDFDPEVTAKIAKLRVRIYETHISYNPRAYVDGKKIKLRDGLTAGWSLLKYSFATPFHRCFRPDLPTRYLRSTQTLERA